MIRYAITPKQLRDKIAAAKANWLDEAAMRTEKLLAVGKFDGPPIWRQIKAVFIAIQHNKCAYCERQLEGVEYGKIEHDLEHFRPKSAIKRWPFDPANYDFATGEAASSGYYWLAYDFLNYSASCKSCNSPLKASYFPIAGKRVLEPSSLRRLRTENAYLCHPVGGEDVDPEDLVTFVATTAVPASSDEAQKRRGRIIIDFFQLNAREQLHRERARMIVLLGNALCSLNGGNGDANDNAIVEACVRDSMPHAACSRAFKALWESDHVVGEQMLGACKAYIGGIAGIPVV